MKRTICILMTLLLLTVMVVPAVTAVGIADETDSTHIYKPLKEAYNESETLLIRIYTLSATQYNLFECLAMDGMVDLIANINDSGYFAYWNDGRVDYLSGTIHSDNIVDYKSMNITANGEAEHQEWGHKISLEVFEFYKQDDLSTHLGNDVIIQKKYFICDWENDNTLILYVTNKGNYVYFDNSQIAPCLFSENAFIDYMQFVYEANNAMLRKDYRYDICDLSLYTVNAESYVPNANNIPWVPRNLIIYVSVALTLLVIAAIVIPVVIYRKKHKDQDFYEAPKSTRFDSDFLICHNIENHTAINEPMPPAPH